MSACEKCWSDAHMGMSPGVAEVYARLLERRKDNPCTPEEQAGPDSSVCEGCSRKTIHQITGECMFCETQRSNQ